MNMKFCTALITVFSLGISGSLYAASCTDANPVRTVVSIGGGQSNSTNSTMYVAFTGHITTTNGLTNRGKNTVKICAGTTVNYTAISNTSSGSFGSFGSVTPPSCINRSSSGTLKPGDKLVCNNKNTGGNDTDRFRVISAR